MAILFSITFIAFCALLWASLSVARHLRRARKTVRDHTANRTNQLLRDIR